MEYHSDRFEDFSLLIYKDEKLVALMPANILDNQLHSHQGLTYGGLIINMKTNFLDVLAAFQAIQSFLLLNKIKSLTIKQIPEIYFKTHASESNFVLSKIASFEKRDMVLAIDFSKPLTIHKTKLKHFSKSKNNNFEIRENVNFKSFWEQILEPRLERKFDSKPIHSIEEIQYLNKLFPNNIKQFNIYIEEKLLAGITIFENEKIIKSQYGATTKAGEKYRALDYLFLHLINKYKAQGKCFFSMGTVSGSDNLGINYGLFKQKQELGCQVYFQDFFTLKAND